MIRIPTVGILLAAFCLPAAGVEVPPEGFKVAFLGDQGLGPASEATLDLIREEGAQLLVHLGDFDYQGAPAAWEKQTEGLLGRDFPQIAVIGNHDTPYWGGPEGYSRYIRERLQRMGVAVEGEAGVQCSFRYRGIFFVLTAPGVMGSGHADFIRRQLQRDSSLWRISAWHVNQSRMQVGVKGDEAGWGVYEESRLGGAIIATAHEHSYSRTHLMSGMADQKVASRSRALRLRKGRSFVFVSGLGGAEIRPQALSGDWWASIYTSTQGAKHGALFATFNVDGDPRKARFYFKNVERAVVDSFEVFSELDKPILPGIAVIPSRGHSLVLDPVSQGLPPGAKFGLLEMSGRTLAMFENLTGPVTVSVPRAGVFLLWGEGVKGRLLRKIVFLP